MTVFCQKTVFKAPDLELNNEKKNTIDRPFQGVFSQDASFTNHQYKEEKKAKLYCDLCGKLGKLVADFCTKLTSKVFRSFQQPLAF